MINRFQWHVLTKSNLTACVGYHAFINTNPFSCNPKNSHFIHHSLHHFFSFENRIIVCCAFFWPWYCISNQMNKSPAQLTDILGKCILREWCVCAIWKRFPVTIWTFLVSRITPMINQTTMPRYHEPMCEFPFSLFIKLQSMTCICIWCLELLGIYLYLNSVIDSWVRQVPHMCNVEWIYPLAQRYVFNNLPEILIWWNNFC